MKQILDESNAYIKKLTLNEADSTADLDIDSLTVVDPVDDTLTGTITDWDAAFKKITDKNINTDPSAYIKFFEKYAKDVWGEDADKIMEIKDAFSKEVEHIGFNENNNPFIAFLKEMQSKNKEVWNKLDRKTYGTIHNAYVSNAITDADLRGLDSEGNPTDKARELRNPKNYESADILRKQLNDEEVKSQIDSQKYIDKIKSFYKKLNNKDAQKEFKDILSASNAFAKRDVDAL